LYGAGIRFPPLANYKCRRYRFTDTIKFGFRAFVAGSAFPANVFAYGKGKQH